jgi:hypothetical protein
MKYSITTRYLDAAIIDQKVAGEFHGKVYAFAPVIENGYRLGVAVANESGYSPIAGKTFERYDEACQWANELNEHIGLSKDEALDIVGSTMGGSRVMTRGG